MDQKNERGIMKLVAREGQLLIVIEGQTQGAIDPPERVSEIIDHYRKLGYRYE